DGHLVTKPFGGPAAPAVTRQDPVGPAELLVLDPVELDVVARLVLPEPSVARLSASGDDVYAVGDDALHRVRWDGRRLVHDEAFSSAARYRTLEGQTFGWDAVIGTDAAWFLDDGEGTEDYAGTLQGCGRSAVPLHLVRVDLATGAVDLHEVSGLPGGIVANPPALVEDRGVVVAYDSGNGRVVAFDIGSPDDAGGTAVRGVRWQRDLGHGSHPLVLGDAGQIVLADHDPVAGERAVVVDLATGEERGRVATGSPVQSVLFPAAGFGRDAYLVSFTTLTRIWVA
ncbi:MAG: hypothetical protein KDA98_10910, partial [Acidimicrobiales bacterium]|nr:hypothetical protein [Acidimicrobiales bacterium]